MREERTEYRRRGSKGEKRVHDETSPDSPWLCETSPDRLRTSSIHQNTPVRGRREKLSGWLPSISNVSSIVSESPVVSPHPFGPDLMQCRHGGRGGFIWIQSGQETRVSVDAVGSGRGVRGCTAPGELGQSTVLGSGRRHQPGVGDREVEGISEGI